MDVGEIVETFRVQRKMTVSELCKGVIADSTYSRFKNGKTMLSADSFIILLSRLGLSFPEASKFNHHIHIINQYKVLVHQYTNENSSELLLDLHDRIMTRVQFKFDSYHLLAIQINLTLMDWEELPFLHDIKDFIFKAEKWTHKEMYLFQIIIEEYDAETVYYLVQQLKGSNTEYLNAEKNVNFILLLSSCFTYFLKNKYIDYAKEMCIIMDDYLQEIGFAALKFKLLIAEVLLDVALEQSEKTIRKVERVYQLCIQANSHYYAQLLNDNYQKIQSVYNLPVLAFEKIN